MTVLKNTLADHPSADLKLRLLSLEQVRRIDEMLASLGDYGEVHLVIQHGQLRYINRVESHKAWNDDVVRGQQE
jgi:hypothetical protein